MVIIWVFFLFDTAKSVNNIPLVLLEKAREDQGCLVGAFLLGFLRKKTYQ